jgi:hypothetical protein
MKVMKLMRSFFTEISELAGLPGLGKANQRDEGTMLPCSLSQRITVPQIPIKNLPGTRPEPPDELCEPMAVNPSLNPASCSPYCSPLPESNPSHFSFQSRRNSSRMIRANPPNLISIGARSCGRRSTRTRALADDDLPRTRETQLGKIIQQKMRELEKRLARIGDEGASPRSSCYSPQGSVRPPLLRIHLTSPSLALQASRPASSTPSPYRKPTSSPTLFSARLVAAKRCS